MGNGALWCWRSWSSRPTCWSAWTLDSRGANVLRRCDSKLCYRGPQRNQQIDKDGAAWATNCKVAQQRRKSHLDSGRRCTFERLSWESGPRFVPWCNFPGPSLFHLQSSDTTRIPPKSHCHRLHGRWCRKSPRATSRPDWNRLPSCCQLRRRPLRGKRSQGCKAVMNRMLGMFENVPISHFCVTRCHDCVDDTRFQIEEDSSGNVMVIVGLIEKHVFTVWSICCKVLENTRRRNAVLEAESFPELKAN